MFNELFVFGKQRNGSQAFGFYLFYLFTTVAISFVSGTILVTILVGFQLERYIGLAAVCLVFSTFLLSKNKSWRNFGWVALGLFLFNVFLIAVYSGLSISNTAMDFEMGNMLGRYLAIVICLVLSFLVLHKKNKLRSTGSVVVAILSGVGAYLLGGLLGLAATAYLTTLKPEK